MTVRPLLTVCAIVLGNGASWADDAPIAVEIVPVEERPLTFEIKLTGTIAAQDSIDLSFPAGGRITSILVQAGDRVTGGYALARSDNVQQQQALVQAQGQRPGGGEQGRGHPVGRAAGGDVLLDGALEEGRRVRRDAHGPQQGDGDQEW